MSKETTNQGYIDALAYATDPDNTDTPDQQHNEYERGIKSYGLSQDGDSAALNSLLTSDTVNNRVGLNQPSPSSDLHITNSSDNAIVTVNSSTEEAIIVLQHAPGKKSAFDTTGGGVLAVRHSGVEIFSVDADGIKFNGDTAAANALSDYEEGNWTPALDNIGTGTYTTQLGTYVKVGSIVHARCTIDMATLGTASGNLLISGLPFPVSSDASLYAVFPVYGDGWAVGKSDLVGVANASSSVFEIFEGNSASKVNSTHASLGTGRLLISFSYEV